MSLSEVLNILGERTVIKTRKNGKVIFVIGSILSALMVYSFYSEGLPQHDAFYSQLPFLAQIPMITIASLWLVLMTSMGILLIKATGEYFSPKVIRGYWKVHSKIIIPEPVRKDAANGVWKYLKLHRKHDPLYQADLNAIRREYKKEIAVVNEKLDYFVRENRIKNLAIEKITKQKIQAEREREQAKQLNQKLTRLIITLSKIIVKLRKRLKGG